MSKAALTIIALFVAANIWILLPYLYRIIQVIKLKKLCRQQKAIVLSYDDGPSTKFTLRLLDLLEQHNASATFFMLGRHVEKNPDVVRKIASAGHEIGSHSYNHLNAWKHLPWKISADVAAGDASIAPFGVGGKLFRPPYGKITMATLLQSFINGWLLAWWTLDSSDTHSTQRKCSDVAASIRVAGGGVILMHDFERQGSSDRNEYVLELTRHLLELAEREKFKILTFSRLLERSEYENRPRKNAKLSSDF